MFAIVRWRGLWLALGAILALPPAGALAEPILWSISPRDAVLRKVDAATGQTVEALVTITLDGESQVRGGNGLARHPRTGRLYALIRVPSSPFRLLVTLDEETGAATRVGPTGDTGDNFASLAFAPDGTLFTMSGDGALNFLPETLCTLSTDDATANCFQELGNGSDGEAIAFELSDGRIYHASGLGVPNDPDGEIFEKVDPSPPSVTPIPLSGYDYQELTALFSWGGAFFAADLGDALTDMPHLLRITRGGSVTLVGSLDHVSRGFATETFEVPSLSPLGLGLLSLCLLAGAAACARTRR